MSPVGLTATAPSRVTAQLPRPPVQPVPYELLKQVNAFALETLKSTPRTAPKTAILFMIERLTSKRLNEWAYRLLIPCPTTQCVRMKLSRRETTDCDPRHMRAAHTR